MIQGYKIIEKLGSGAFGESFLCEKEGERVVIKQLKLTHVDRWKVVERFHREGKMLQKLQHPNIPRYIDFIEVDHFLGIV